MKDFFGNEIRKGDTVAFHHGIKGLMKAKVIGFTKDGKQIGIEYTDYWTYIDTNFKPRSVQEILLVYPNQVIKRMAEDSY